MKRILLILSVLITGAVFGQSVPQGINYQAVARNNNGSLMANTTLTGVRFSILSSVGPDVVQYQEVHNNVPTNQFGLFTRVIGTGTQTGGLAANFASIPWGASQCHIKIEVDQSGWIDMGTLPFWAVPYAFVAGNVLNGGVGPTGPQGANGSNGINGVTGPTGPQGIQGPQGPSGGAGATGPQGPAGANGATGANGAPGAQGPAGANGATGATGDPGAQGPAGPAGAPGAPGPIGAPGAPGAPGAQGPAGANGATGATGDPGAQGPAGPAGAQGPAGPAGVQGPAGPAGSNGATGATGDPGAQGPAGPAGAQGPAGPTGVGVTGPQGPTGLLQNGDSAGDTPYWDGSAWVTTSSNIYNNGGNVGVGTVSPTEKLDVYGNIKITATIPASDRYVYVGDNQVNGSWGSSLIVKAGDGTVPGPSAQGGGNATLQGGNQYDSGDFVSGGSVWLKGGINTIGGLGPNDGNIYFNTNNTDRGTVTNSGRFGIGTTTPSATLDVVGSFRYDNGSQVNGYILTTDGSGNATWAAPSGLQGPAGPAGPQGPAGPAGSVGAQGPAGAQGAQGVAGPAGAQGPTGPGGTTASAGVSQFTGFVTADGPWQTIQTLTLTTTTTGPVFVEADGSSVNLADLVGYRILMDGATFVCGGLADQFLVGGGYNQWLWSIGSRIASVPAGTHTFQFQFAVSDSNLNCDIVEGYFYVHN